MLKHSLQSHHLLVSPNDFRILWTGYTNKGKINVSENALIRKHRKHQPLLNIRENSVPQELLFDVWVQQAVNKAQFSNFAILILIASRYLILFFLNSALLDMFHSDKKCLSFINFDCILIGFNILSSFL